MNRPFVGTVCVNPSHCCHHKLFSSLQLSVIISDASVLHPRHLRSAATSRSSSQDCSHFPHHHHQRPDHKVEYSLVWPKHLYPWTVLLLDGVQSPKTLHKLYSCMFHIFVLIELPFYKNLKQKNKYYKITVNTWQQSYDLHLANVYFYSLQLERIMHKWVRIILPKLSDKVPDVCSCLSHLVPSPTYIRSICVCVWRWCYFTSLRKGWKRRSNTKERNG